MWQNEPRAINAIHQQANIHANYIEHRNLERNFFLHENSNILQLFSKEILSLIFIDDRLVYSLDEGPEGQPLSFSDEIEKEKDQAMQEYYEG